MKVKNSLVADESLIIYQNSELNSFTFDSLILYAYTKITKRDKYVVDLCAGNGPVTMLLARNNPDLDIYGVEIQKDVYDLAMESITENALENIEFINSDLKGISKVIGQNKFNIITCNPPYFKVTESSKLNENQSIAIARHELKINLEEILVEAKTLLKNDGRLIMVHRPERLSEIIIKLNNHNFHIKRLQFIYPKKGKEANTIIFEARKGLFGKMRIDPPLFVYDEDGYTEDVKKLLDM